MGALLGSGHVLAGRYRLLSQLGSGGMGTVWLGQDVVLGRQVAVKEVSPPSEISEEERGILRERTMREARTAARLTHPNVVPIYDVVEDGGRPWIVMALISARSLRDIVQEDGPLTPQQAAKVALQVLAALTAAHALGIMHRDVKPGNVLIDADGRAVLADFGIARADDSPTLTSSGMLVGSPSYIAPERARGERGGAESDLWSLGATLYAVVEGRPPYDRPGALATLTAVVTEDPDPPSRAGHTAPLPIPAEWGEPGEAAVDRPRPGGRLGDAEHTRAFHPQAIEPAASPAVTAAGAAPLPAVEDDVPAAVEDDVPAAAENEEPEPGEGPHESASAPDMATAPSAPSSRTSATIDTTPAPVPMSPAPDPVPMSPAPAPAPVPMSPAPAPAPVPIPGTRPDCQTLRAPA